MFFLKVYALKIYELKEQGKLIVDGGNGTGGAGGIIQIISPAGRLHLKALSLKRGKKHGPCFTEAKHGYYYFEGGNFS